MERKTHDSDAVPQHALEKPETASKKSGILNAIRRSLTEPMPSVKALDALAEVQSPAPEPQPHESVGEVGIAGNIYKVDEQDCGDPTT